MIASWLQQIVEQPLLVREMRSRMRGTRAYWILFTYLLVLALFVLFTYLSLVTVLTHSNNGRLRAAHEMSQSIFTAALAVQLFLIFFVIPAITSGSISQEREQQSLDLLLTTPLSRARIVFGKLLSSTAFIFLLIATSLPIVTLSFLFGGVSTSEIVAAYFFLVGFSVLNSALGLMWSSIARTTVQAAVFTYLTAFALSLGIPSFALGYLLSGVTQASGQANLLAISAEYILFFVAPMSICMYAVTWARLQTEPANHAGWPRLLFLLLVNVYIFLSLWSLNSQAALLGTLGVAKASSSFLSGAYYSALGYLGAIAVPLCTTGALYADEISAQGWWRYLFSGWRLRGLWRATPASGMAYAILLVVSGFASITLAFLASPRFTPSLHQLLAPSPQILPVLILGALIAFVGGLSLLCMLLSFWMHRYAILAIGLLYALPLLFPVAGLSTAQIYSALYPMKPIASADASALAHVIALWLGIGAVSQFCIFVLLRSRRSVPSTPSLQIREVPHEPASPSH